MKRQMRKETVKDPNWPEANQLPIYKAWPRIRNSDYRAPDSGSGESGNPIRDFRVSSPASVHILGHPTKEGRRTNDAI